MTISSTSDRRVAICVCTHNRAEVLKRLLLTLRDIELNDCDPANVELIVIDNNPNSATRDICEQTGTSLPIRVHYTTEPEPGITHARNRAVAVAIERGAGLIAFIDDDDVPHSDWLLQLLERQHATGRTWYSAAGSWTSRCRTGRANPVFSFPTKTKQDKRGALRLAGLRIHLQPAGGQDILRVGAASGRFSPTRFATAAVRTRTFSYAPTTWAQARLGGKSIIHRIHGPERYTARRPDPPRLQERLLPGQYGTLSRRW